VPQANKKFQRLLKNAAKRMSTSEYRKSQSLKGGEVRLLQQMGASASLSLHHAPQHCVVRFFSGAH
jgi:hypothetical protein